MRCYRCGAIMSADADTCPECGFYTMRMSGSKILTGSGFAEVIL